MAIDWSVFNKEQAKKSEYKKEEIEADKRRQVQQHKDVQAGMEANRAEIRRLDKEFERKKILLAEKRAKAKAEKEAPISKPIPKSRKASTKKAIKEAGEKYVHAVEVEAPLKRKRGRPRKDAPKRKLTTLF